MIAVVGMVMRYQLRRERPCARSVYMLGAGGGRQWRGALRAHRLSDAMLCCSRCDLQRAFQLLHTRADRPRVLASRKERMCSHISGGSVGGIPGTAGGLSGVFR